MTGRELEVAVPGGHLGIDFLGDGPPVLRARRAPGRMHHGWTGDGDEVIELAGAWVREAPDDWLNAGARAGLVEEVGRRSFGRHGFYAARREEVAALVAADPRRTLVELDSNHNVPMTAPGPLARVVLDVVAGAVGQG